MGPSAVLVPSDRGSVISWVNESVGSVSVAVFELVGAEAPGLDVLFTASESLFAFRAEMER